MPPNFRKFFNDNDLTSLADLLKPRRVLDFFGFGISIVAVAPSESLY